MLQQLLEHRTTQHTGDGDDLQAQARRRFGRSMAPLPATAVYHRALHTLSNNQLTVEKWVLINHAKGLVIHLTTFNGRPGSNFDPAAAARPFDLFELCQRLRDYQQVPVSRCPLACMDAIVIEEQCDWRWIGA